MEFLVIAIIVISAIVIYSASQTSSKCECKPSWMEHIEDSTGVDSRYKCKKCGKVLTYRNAL